MNCLTCRWRDMPAVVRRDKCIACSTREYSQHRFNTNELSNKGHTFVPYERDAFKGEGGNRIDKDYQRVFMQQAARRDPHPAEGLTIPEYAADGNHAVVAYELVKRFIYDLGQLTDRQIVLFVRTAQGMKPGVFAETHRMKPSAVSQDLRTIRETSAIFRQMTGAAATASRGDDGEGAKKRGRSSSGPKRSAIANKQMDLGL